MDFTPWLNALRTAPTAPGEYYSPFKVAFAKPFALDAKAAADRLAREVAKTGIYSLQFVVRNHCN